MQRNNSEGDRGGSEFALQLGNRIAVSGETGAELYYSGVPLQNLWQVLGKRRARHYDVGPGFLRLLF